MTFRKAAAPLDISISELFVTKLGNSCTLVGVAGVLHEDSDAIKSFSAFSSPLARRRRCCHFVTCDRTSLRAFEALTCDGWSEFKKAKTGPVDVVSPA
jgi:hypothetical protein